MTKTQSKWSIILKLALFIFSVVIGAKYLFDSKKVVVASRSGRERSTPSPRDEEWARPRPPPVASPRVINNGGLTDQEKKAGLLALNEGRRLLAPLPGSKAGTMPDLQWDPALEAVAQQYVNRCPSGHNPEAGRLGLGENIGWGYASLADTVQAWNAEKSNIVAPTTPANPATTATLAIIKSAIPDKGLRFDPSTSAKWCQGGWSNCGHFTQDIWAKTTRVGCAKPQTPSCPVWGDKIYVCNFAPAGNISNALVYEY